MKKFLVVMLSVLSIFLTIFSATGQARPRVLRMALIPAEAIEEMIRAFTPAKKYLEKELGMEIELFRAIDYTAVVEALRAKKIDIAQFGPFSYVLAAERANARAIVGAGGEDGKPVTFHSILITHRDSGLKTMEDVKARAKQLTVAFVDPASTSGHLVPRGGLEDAGIRVDDGFKEIIFAGGHDASILAVNARKVDLGAVREGRFQRSIDRGVVAPGEIRVIWRSPPIPPSPIAVRGDLDSSLIQKIQQAFLDMPKNAPEAFKQFGAQWDSPESFARVSDSDYDYIRRIAIKLGKLD